MPTGYTAGIAGMTFKEFALGCARAFGATIAMRDDPADAVIPVFVESPFYAEHVEAAERDLAKLQAMDADEAEKAALAEYLTACEMNQTRRAEYRELRNQYNAMLAKVVEWVPPTQDHVGMKDFMLEQLRTSIDFDCNEEYIVDPPRLDGATWIAQRLDHAKNNHERACVELGKEIGRVASRNAWVDALKASLV